MSKSTVLRKQANGSYKRQDLRHVKKSRHSRHSGGIGPFIIIAAFIALALLALNDKGMGYDAADIAALDEVATASQSNAEKLAWLFKDDGQPVAYPMAHPLCRHC